MRRFGPIGAVLLAVCCLAIVGVAPAAAQATGPWQGSSIANPAGGAAIVLESFEVSAPLKYKTPSPGVGGSIDGGRRIASASVKFDADPDYDLADSCTLPQNVTRTFGPEANVAPGETHQTTVTAPATFRCNGSYLVTVTAKSSADYGGRVQSTSMQTAFDVTVPPAVVAAPQLSLGEGREVVVKWQPPSTQAPDFAGYAVERRDPGATEFVALGTTNETLVKDKLPAPAGDYTYRVLALRTSPRGAISSPPGSTPTSSITASAAPTTTTAPGGSGSGGGSGGGDGSQPPATFSSGAGQPPPVGAKLTLPSVQIPDFGVPTTLDTGFDDFLPYSSPDEQLGPDEELGSGGFEVFEREGDPFVGQGLWKPAAGTLVLAMWALLFRHVSRLAKQPAAG